MTKTAKSLGLVITDGVGYRNFILSNFLEEASQNFERLVIYSGLPRQVYELSSYLNIEVRILPLFREPSSTWFWRKSKELAHLQLHKGFFGIYDNLLASRGQTGSMRGKATKLLYAGTKFIHSERAIGFLENRQERSLEENEVAIKCLQYLEKDQPDLLFFTHQRPPYVVPLIVAAKKMGINTASFIFSWDNLASKGRMAANFENYLVWSELMKKELLYFYPSTTGSKIKVAGTPQFEPYVMPKYHSNKEGFYSRFKLNPNLKTICYSCGDISTSRNDELYIETIARAMQEEEINEQVNLLVRTSPAEDPDRFFQLKGKFPFIKWNFPDWPVSRLRHPEPWSQRVPTETDIINLRSILQFSDLNVNMCSTMSLDFMMFDKPVINPVFGNKENGLYNDQRFLKFGHYEKVVESGAVKVARNKVQLLEAINFYLNNPAEDSANRKKLLDLQIGKPLENTSQRIALALAEIV